MSRRQSGRKKHRICTVICRRGIIRQVPRVVEKTIVRGAPYISKTIDFPSGDNRHLFLKSQDTVYMRKVKSEYDERKV